MTGIEPAPSAWEAEVLPLNYIRMALDEGSVSPSAWLVPGSCGTA